MIDIFDIARAEAEKLGLSIGKIYRDENSCIFVMTDGSNPPTPSLPIIEVFEDGRIEDFILPNRKNFERLNKLRG